VYISYTLKIAQCSQLSDVVTDGSHNNVHRWKDRHWIRQTCINSYSVQCYAFQCSDH